MKRSILVDREDIRKVEAEEQFLFIFSILEQIGIPEENLLECFPEGGPEAETVEHRIALKKLCNHYNLVIDRDQDGEIKIYVGEELIAHWKKSWWQMRVDPSQRDRSKRIYAEMFLESWSMYEEHNER